MTAGAFRPTLRAWKGINDAFGPPIHPPWLRCSSLKYPGILGRRASPGGRLDAPNAPLIPFQALI
jgi:hypothetical protein